MTSDAPVRESGEQSKAKVFISYSRKDMAFADRLETALKARGFEPLIDRTEIYAFEEWWKRIEALIARADTVVFVLSPDAVASNVALREVSFAASLNKRFAPVVCRRVDDNAVPEALSKLNFVFFDDEGRFEQSADRLAEALNTDIGWIRQHTDFGEQARRWSQAKGASGLLLRSPVCWSRQSVGLRQDQQERLHRLRKHRRSSGKAARGPRGGATSSQAVWLLVSYWLSSLRVSLTGNVA
jgi:TIR domain